MDIEGCLREGHLKRVKPDRGEIEKELLESADDLDMARSSYEAHKYKWATVQAYYSMFHAARSVILSMGLKERRHYAIEVVLREFVKERKLDERYLDDFKAAMYCREEADYGSTYSADKARDLLEAAGEFNDKMKTLGNTR